MVEKNQQMQMGTRASAAAVAALLLSACGTVPTWTSERLTDRFSDSRSCRVMPSAIDVNNALRPYNMSFYPFVERRDDQLRVGLISGGLPMPTGRVQLRIDDHPAWTIETSETPVDSAQFSPEAMMDQMRAANGGSLTQEMEALFRQSSTASANNINQAMSPYTAATGDKATAILAQMRLGQQVIYRQLGANAAGSTTGSIALGEEFRLALADCDL